MHAYSGVAPTSGAGAPGPAPPQVAAQGAGTAVQTLVDTLDPGRTRCGFRAGPLRLVVGTPVPGAPDGGPVRLRGAPS